MDIQAEKLALIQWLVGINDIQIINTFRALKQASEEASPEKLNVAEEEAISQGILSVKNGRTKTNEEVTQLTREKYPQLFR